MGPSRAPGFRARSAALACLVTGTLCLGLGAICFTLSRNVFDSTAFGHRAAESLSDPGVSHYAANLITDQLVQRKPDLIAFRPLLLSASETVVSSRPFRSVVDQAAARAHRLAFSEGSQRVILSLPDLSILVRDAVGSTNPALASKVPKSLDTALARVAGGPAARILLDAARAGRVVRWLWPLFFALAIVFYVLAHLLAFDRRRAMAVAGAAMMLLGLALAGIVALNALSGLWFHDPANLGLVRGLWRTYLGELARIGFLIAGIGVLVAAGASSLLERMDPFQQVASLARRFSEPPKTRGARLAWGSAAFILGCAMFLYPQAFLIGTTIAAGVCISYVGARELFRVFVEAVEAAPATSRVGSAWRGRRLATMAILVLVLALGSVWAVSHRSVVAPVAAAAPKACNGYPELCDRPLDQVVFAGAHNAMSNQEVPGWMFPHHQAGIPQMLRDGIRALLIDIHYGFPAEERIKTDMSTEPSADKIKAALGSEAYDAAMRIRDRLIGVNEAKRGLYFCHGFCELGAYLAEPVLHDIRDFAVSHPDEVIILVIEDYVTPQDLAAAFDQAELSSLVYRGKPSPPWPTLRQLIESGQRILVFLESGKPGVPWLFPAFQTFRETPYTFHTVDEFSCRANRGGDAGSLFQINHWIDTTPAPRPSNAAIVNAYPFLLARVERCAEQRRHRPNLIAVDFYRSGDLFAVVNKLNGVGGPPDAE